MPGPALSAQNRFYFVAFFSVALILTVFVASWHIPFRIEGDTAYAAKIAQQYVAGSADFNRITLVDPRDLANDSETWIYWWPPGIVSTFIIFFKLGLSASAAGRLLMLGAALAGGIGWALVSAMIFDRRIALALATVPPLFYVFQSSMFFSFTEGDVLVFSIMPWVFALCIYVVRRIGELSWRQSMLLLWTACFLLGSLYWLKFSTLFGTAGLSAFLALAVARNYSPRRTVLYVIVGLVVFFAPIAVLWNINKLLGGDIVMSHISLGAQYANLTSSTFKALSTVVLPIGAGAERIFRGGHGLLSDWLVYLPGLALLFLTIGATFTQISFEFAILGSLLVLVPIVGLVYLTSHSNYDFILDAGRHASPYWIFLQLLLIALLTREIAAAGRWERGFRIVLIGLTAYCCVLAAFIPSAAVKTALRVPPSGACPPTGLYVATLSQTNPAAVATAIRNIIRDDDVVVPATYWLGQETWLELPGRLLPLTNFWEPLMETHGRSGADYFGSTPFRSSRPLRVVLIAPDPYSRPDYDQAVDRIKARFPQAHDWSLELSFPTDRVQVWVANLAAN